MSAQSILANVRDKRHRQWSVSFAGPNKRHCYEVCTENTVAESCCSFPKRAGQRERQGEIRAIRVPHLPMISPNVEEHLSIRNMCAAPASALNSDHVGTHVWRGWHHWKRNQPHQKETTNSERFGVRIGRVFTNCSRPDCQSCHLLLDTSRVGRPETKRPSRVEEQDKTC
jgi:hypothetical protein